VLFRSVEIRVDNQTVDATTAFSLLSNAGGKNCIFPILITNRLLFQPANTDKNLLAAILWRTHNDPFVGGVPWNARKDNWEQLVPIFTNLFPQFHNEEVSIQENINLMGKKGVRLASAYEANMKGIIPRLAKTINLKWNETIPANKSLDGVETLKPRAIQNLPAIIHAFMGGRARELSSILHNVFDGRVVDVSGVPVRIYFASGYTQQQLSEIGNAMTEGGCVIAVSGDDSAATWGGICNEFGGEADQSMFDHTQDDGPMRVFMRPVLQLLGFDDNFIDLAYSACKGSYTAKGKRVFVRGFAGTQMPTGITTTTSFNTISTICMYLWFIKNRSRLNSVDQAGHELGFKVKYFPRESLGTITFLKGWFQSDGHSQQWLPLPSAILKLGKVLRNPCEITMFKTKTGTLRYHSPDAVAICAHALSQSYGNIPLNYPILGRFVHTLQRLGSQPRSEIPSLVEGWKPKIPLISLDRASVLENINFRYGIPPSTIQSFEQLLDEITELPAYIEHPVCDLLCEVDY
jgi:hypothetical protein